MCGSLQAVSTSPRQPSLLGRALLALLLLVGFYVLAIAIVVGLAYLPYAEWRYVGQIHIRIVFFALGGAALILWSLLPRWDHFPAPGPRLDLGRHPRLAHLIDSLAAETGQSPPKDVYIVAELNAWVAQRGGVMGIGSRRVMGLGLPLMSGLTVSQFSAILAHEFGHYHGGDTALGPWIYKTRAAIALTLANLSEHSGLLQLPFIWYGNLFLRITLGISRAQEYAADDLAARIVGPKPLAEGLRTIHGLAGALGGYWRTVYGPLIDRGYRAPFQQGFQAFIASSEITTIVEKNLAEELSSPTSGPYDTHPPLRDRLAALGQERVTSAGDGTAMAVTLLEGAPSIEEQWLAFVIGPSRVSQLTSIDWDEVPLRAWAPIWRHLAIENRERLKGVTPALLSRMTPHPHGLAVALKFAAYSDVAVPRNVLDASAAFGACLATILLDRGWHLRADLGGPVVLSKGEWHVEPFDAWAKIAAGTLSQATWQQMLEVNGLTDVDLANVAAQV